MVRCVNCGFLAYRNPETKTLDEVEEGARRTGTLSIIGAIVTAPCCFVMAADLFQERKALETHQIANGILSHEVPYRENNLTVLTRERECRRFCDWSQGFSPKEHKLMLHDLELRKLEDEREERNRKWAAEQKDADHKRTEEQKAGDRRWQLKLAILAAAFSLFTGTIGLFLGKMLNPPSQPVAPIINIIPQKDGVKVDVPTHPSP